MPYLRCPLVVEFFAAGRVGALFNPRLRSLLEAVIFEPQLCATEGVALDHAAPAICDSIQSWLARLVPDPAFHAVPVLPRDRAGLGSPRGVLLEELRMNPGAVLEPLLRLARNSVTLCASGDCRSAFVPLLLFVVRVVSRVMSFVAWVATRSEPTSSAVAELDRGFTGLGAELFDGFSPLLSEWSARADELGLVERAVALHAHRVLALAHLDPRDLGRKGPLGSPACHILQSICYVVAWHSPTSVSWVPTSQSVDLCGEDGGAGLCVPLHDAFAAFHRLRAHLVLWVDGLPSAAQSHSEEELSRDAVLSTLCNIALRRNDGPSRTWEAVPSSPPECLRVLETAHPYAPSTDMYWVVSFPGAQRMALRFDERCATEKGADYVTVYKDESLSSRWGSVIRYSGTGSAGSGWPGANGRPPLHIPAGRCIVHFHSDESASNWGVRIECSAPVDAVRAHDLLSECLGGDVGASLSCRRNESSTVDSEIHSASPSFSTCLQAMALACNDLDTARRIVADSTRQGGFPRDVLTVSESFRRGWFRSTSDDFTVNLQSAEVFVRQRAVSRVPHAIASHPDFQDTLSSRTVGDSAVAESDVGLMLAADEGGAEASLSEGGEAAGQSISTSTTVCVIASRSSQCTSLHLFQGERHARYDVHFWSPLKPDCPALLPEEVPESERSGTDLDGTYLCHGFPRTVATSGDSVRVVADGGVMWWSGRRYSQRYELGSLENGASALLDGVVEDAVSRLGLSDDPVIWRADPATELAESVVEPVRLLMWVPPQGDAVVRRGALGLYFDVLVWAANARTSMPYIEVFQILDHGRQAMRCLVFASSASMCLRSLPLSISSADRKDCGAPGAAEAGGCVFGSLPPGRHVADVDESGWGAGHADGDDGDAYPERSLTDDDGDDDASNPRADACGLNLNLSRACGVMMTMSAAGLSVTEDDGTDADTSSVGSLVVQRTLYVSSSSGVVTFQETALPYRDVAGLLPECLLSSYALWLRRHAEDASQCVIVGYPKEVKPSGPAPATVSGLAIGRNSAGFAEDDLLLVEPVGAEWRRGVVRITAPASRHSPDVRDVAAWHSPLLHAAGFRALPCAANTSRVVLANLHSAALASPLRRLADVFTKMETLSHILVWGRLIEAQQRPEAMEGLEEVTASFSDGLVAIETIELPRLGLRFVVKAACDQGMAGAGAATVAVHVLSVDHAGQRLSDRRPAMTSDGDALPFSIVLENAEGDLALMSPSFGVRRPRIRTLPFSRTLLPRRMPDWIRHVTSRVIVFPFHPSMRFIAPSSFGGALFLAIMALLRRQYVLCAAVLRICATDQPLTQEQRWLISQVRAACGYPLHFAVVVVTIVFHHAGPVFLR